MTRRDLDGLYRLVRDVQDTVSRIDERTADAPQIRRAVLMMQGGLVLLGVLFPATVAAVVAVMRGG